MNRRLVLGVGTIVIVGAIVAGVMWWRDRGSAAPAADEVESAAAESPLAARLSLVIGGDGDGALAIVRVANLDARQPATIRVDTPVTVDFASVSVSLEMSDAAAAATAIASSILRRPEPAVQVLDARTTATTFLTIAPAALPPAGTRVRAQVVVPGGTLVTNWAVMPPLAASATERLINRAQLQDMQGADDALAATASELIATAPDNSNGHFYRGVVLERRGDRAGALAAYQAALDRVPAGFEPPIALIERIRRVQ